MIRHFGTSRPTIRPGCRALVAAAALLLPPLLAPNVHAQDGAQPRAIPKGFVLPGPAPKNSPSEKPGSKETPASGGSSAAPGDESEASRAGRPMDFAKTPQTGTTNWPCIQQKLGSIQTAQVWNGPPLPDASSQRLSADESQLIDRIAARRLSVDEASRMVKDYVESRPAAERKDAATRLMAGLLGRLNTERSEVMDGIERYGAKQKALAQRLREQSADFARVQRDAFSSYNDIENARQALLWDTRVFDERRKSLSYVCEVPTLIEQRAFALGRAIASTL